LLKFIKYHWFGLFISIIIGLLLVQFTLVLISPHHDAKQRGFSICTQEMSDQIAFCDSQNWCILKSIIKNTFCDTKIIITGAKNWISGQQPRPWSNYIFVPVLSQTEEPDQDLEEYYQSQPDLAQQIEQLKQKNQQLEKKIDEHRKSSGMGSD